MRKIFLLILMLINGFQGVISLAEEGMFPMSELKNIDLKKAGFKLTSDEIFNPNGISLVDALVRVGGCTGSFVSNEGLIVTNHHCAYGSVAEASTVEKDYLKNGFLAKMKSEEIPTKMTLKITAGYEDISNEILDAAKNISDPVKRLDSIKTIIRAKEKDASKKDSTSLFEVSEMFPGKSYVLFKYKTIKDIRLVYVPPITIGNFGGETDNWVWPRHTGDFSFLRAYVSPDGKPAEYSEKNIPYKPINFLKINPAGVSENDFVFILGYPGRTMRHYPSQFLEYQEKFILPYVSDLYDWLIEEMEKSGKNNPERKLEFASRIKSLANVTKNYKGKMQGIDRTELIKTKMKEEELLQKSIEGDSKLKEMYADVLPKLSQIYSDARKIAPKEFWLDQFNNQSYYMFAANLIITHREKMEKLSADEKKKYIQDNASKVLETLSNKAKPIDVEFEKKVFVKFLTDASNLPSELSLQAVNKITGSKNKQQEIINFVNNFSKKSALSDFAKTTEMLKNNPEKFFAMKDGLIEFANDLAPEYKENSKRKKERESSVNVYLPKLLDVKMKLNNTGFLPDANATLRLTYGSVKGYSPSDGVYHFPFTSLKGIIEKGTTTGDFEISSTLKELYWKGELGSYVHPKLKDVPVGLLYNLDTTGGNSGSPVMNNKGELIGVNFDRAYTATINDFAWNESYSRSIAVDIRYVLWVLDKVANADNLLNEMKVN